MDGATLAILCLGLAATIVLFGFSWDQVPSATDADLGERLLRAAALTLTILIVPLALLALPALWLWSCKRALRTHRSPSLPRELALCAGVGSLPGLAIGVLSQPGWPLYPLLEDLSTAALVPLPVAAGGTLALLVTLFVLWARGGSRSDRVPAAEPDP